MPDENYYKDRGSEKKWPKILLMILGALVIALVIFFLIRGCQGNKNDSALEKSLLDAGKEYYKAEETLLPQATGECKTVSLGSLLENKYLTDSNKYGDCNKDKTYVKVCKLESGSYHYLPVMQCGNKLADSYFKAWKDGSEADLVKDKSDVRFTFYGEKLEVSDSSLGEEKEAWLDELNGTNYKTISSTKYYRYRDMTWKWSYTNKDYYSDLYYASSPASGYTNVDNQTTGWKWYTEVTSNSTQVVRENPTIVDVDIYRKCTYSKDENQFYTLTNKECSTKGPDYNETSKWYGNCTGKVYKDKCYICPTGTTLSDGQCVKTVNGTTTNKKYYPSGSSTADGENIYYTSAPVSGAKKDEGTSATVGKYYKSNTKTTSNYSSTAPVSNATKVGDGVWSSWSEYNTSEPKSYANTRDIETRTKVVVKDVKAGTNLDNWKPISDDYLSESDLIAKFKSLQYEVNSLENIEKASDLRYKVKLQYRNRK